MNSLPVSARPPAFSDYRPPADAQPELAAASRQQRSWGQPRGRGQGGVLAGLLGLWTEVQRHAAQYGHNRGAGLALNDGLTGLPNRRALHERLQALLSGRSQAEPTVRGRGQGQPTWSVLLIDIDHFRQVSGEHGAQAADEVLRTLTIALRTELRQADVLGRWSGEEFLALLPETAFEGALVAAERVRRAVGLRTFPHVGGVTVSIGVASCLPGDTLERVVARADAGVDAARRGGRNRVAFSE